MCCTSSALPKITRGGRRKKKKDVDEAAGIEGKTQPAQSLTEKVVQIS
jgi:hypothetical protein